MFNYGQYSRGYDNPMRQQRIQPFAPQPMMSTPMQAPAQPPQMGSVPPLQQSTPQANYGAIAQQMSPPRMGIGRTPQRGVAY